MVSVMLLCFAVVSVSVLVSSNVIEGSKPAVPTKTKFLKSLKDARLFTVQALQDSNTQTTDQWKETNPHRHSRIRVTPETCKAFVQGLTDSSTGELMWDAHRCTVLTLVYKCHAKVRLLTRSGRHILAEGEDKKELFLEILVDEGHRRVIPLDGIASRELAMLLAIHQQQEGQADLPDFHIKKQQVLGPDFFGQEEKESYGFNECD